MNCDQISPLLGAYCDGELDLLRTIQLEEHVAACAACGGKLESLSTVRRAVASPGLYYAAPAALADRLRTAIAASGAASTSTSIPGSSTAASSTAASIAWPRRLFGRHFALAASVLLLIGVASAIAIALNQADRSRDRQLAADIVAAHVRSVMADRLHLVDIQSNDQHNVKPWFIGKIDFAPDVPKLDDRGFPLLGGRLDYVAGHPAAALVYGARKHVINLFLWPAAASGRASTNPAAASAAAAAETDLTLQGYHLRHWTCDGMECWAVTDASPETLHQFQVAYTSR